MPKKTLVRDRILAFIISYQDEHGFSPSMREIANGVGLTSVGSVHRHIEILKSKGILQDTQHSSSRTLVVNKQMRSMFDISQHDECVRHICLKTEEGTSIILNCLSKQGNITFDGAVYIQGGHDFAGNVVACQELSEPDYLSMIE